MVQNNHYENKDGYEVQMNALYVNNTNHITSFISHATSLQVGKFPKAIKGAKHCDELVHKGAQV